MSGTIREALSKFVKSKSKTQHGDVKYSCGKVPLALFVFLSLVPLSTLNKTNLFLYLQTLSLHLPKAISQHLQPIIPDRMYI